MVSAVTSVEIVLWTLSETDKHTGLFVWLLLKNLIIQVQFGFVTLLHVLCSAKIKFNKNMGATSGKIHLG